MIPVSPPDRREDLTRRALEALRRARDAGYGSLASLRGDHDLDPLRDRDDFRLLMLDLAMPADPFAPAR